MLLVAAALASIGAAHAQSESGASLGANASPFAPPLLVEKNAIGIPVGGFTFLPKVQASASYDDNVYLRDDHKVGDAIFAINPSVELLSDWSDDALNLHAYTIDTRYTKYTSNNTDQYQGSADGILTINRSLVLSGNASYGHLIEPRGTPGDDFTVGRFVFYEETVAAGKLAYRYNRLLTTAGYNFTRRTYDDLVIGDVRASQKYRNHNLGDINLRFDYEKDATTMLFISGARNNFYYSEMTPQFDRTSSGFAVLAGVNTELTRLIKGEIGLGYLRQDFKQANFASFGGFDYQVDVTYTPTALTTVRFLADRDVLDAGNPLASGVISSRFRGTIEHDLTQKVILQAFAEHNRDFYRGIDRRDNRLYFGLSANYTLRRSISLAPFYKYQARTSSGRQSVIPSHDNRVGLTLILAQ